MTLGEFGPLVAAFVLAAIGAALAPLVPPRSATRLLVASIVATVAAVVWALLIVALAGLAGRTGTIWPGIVPEHHHLPEPLGIAAVVLLLVGALRACIVATRRRSTRQRWRTSAPVEFRDLDSADAFVVPGRPGGIIIDQRLWSSLEVDERSALFAHERTHLRCKHHRHLDVAELCAVACPLLAPQRARIRLTVERWADEEAAEVVGDRELVARAIARAALLGADPRVALAFGGSATMTRVRALLEPPVAPGPWTLLGRMDTLAIVLLAGVQLHHLMILLNHVD